MSTESNNSNEFREQGNQAFKKGQFQEAIDRYTDALNGLNDLQLSDAVKNDLTKCYSNRSQCYINLNQYDDAIEDATRGREQAIKYFL
jgi:DnaJ family protein C protein 7